MGPHPRSSRRGRARRSPRGRAPVAGRRLLDRILAANQRQRQIIEDLTALSRASSGPVNRDLVDVSSLAESVIDACRQLEPERQVTVTVVPMMVAFADGPLLRIVLENLIGNAWKFTSRTAEACIGVGSYREGKSIVYYVRDNGAGFDMRFASGLFAPFRRMHCESEFQGTGIGLSTVQRIVRKHKGKIRLESVPGQGTTAFFTLDR